MMKNELNLSTQFASNQLYFDNKSYHHFLEDIKLLSQNVLTSKEVIEVSEVDPYLFLVKVFSIWSIKKTPLLISPKETNYFKSKLLEDVDYCEFKTDTKINNEIELNFDPSNLKIYFLSSGSTGHPKIIVHSLNNLIASSDLFAKFFKSTPEESYYLNLPLNHVGGFLLALRAFLNKGHIITKLSEELDYISYVSLVPTQIDRIIQENSSMFQVLKNCKALLIGGAALSETTAKILKNNNITFYETYGMTETASFIALNHQVLDGCSIVINQDGRVLVSSPALFLGFIKNKTFIPRTDISFKEALYYQTNDLGIIKDNSFYFKGRADQQIVSGGEKISLHYVEQAIKKLSLFTDFKLIGINDPMWGERLVCFYQDSNASIGDVKKQLALVLNHYQIPKDFINMSFVDSTKMKITHQDYQFGYLKYLFDYKYLEKSKDSELIVIFHGFMEDYNDWNFLVPQLTSNYNILMINLPGHGKTLAQSFIHLNDLLEKLIQFIFHFSPTPHLLGYSMGGRVALEISKQIQSIKSLTMISSGLGLIDLKSCQDRSIQDQELFKNITSQEDLKLFFDKWYSNPIFGNYQSYPFYANEVERKMKHSFQEWQQGINILTPGNFPLKADTLKFLLENDIKINYFYGEEDSKYASEAQLLKNYKNVNLILIKDAFHNLHKTHPNIVLQSLLKIF